MAIFTGIVIVIHVLVSLGLVGLILIHAGRGGGLSDVFGGGMSGPASGGATLAERNLDRLTVIVGIAFTITTIGLTWLLSV